MDTPPETPPPRPFEPPPRIDGPTTVEANKQCLQCGYNLRGLPVTGTCPECGASVARSLRGNFLEFALADYLASLQRGAVLVMAGNIGALVIGFLMLVLVFSMGFAFRPTGGGRTVPAMARAPNQLELYSALLTLGTTGVVFLGWWLLSARDPGHVGEDDSISARKLVRIVVGVQTGAALLTFAVQACVSMGLLTPGPTSFDPARLAPMACSLFSSVASIVGFFASMQYLRHLAIRIPDRGLFERATRFMWMGPVIYIFGFLCFGIGPLVALILYLLMINEVRLNVVRIREIQSQISWRPPEDPLPS